MGQSFKKGDTGEPYQGTVEDSDGAVDLSVSDGVEFYMENAETGNLKVDGGTMTITDAANGKVEYAWTSSDVDTAGTFKAEVKVLFPDDNRTFPSNGYKSIKIEEDLEDN